MRPMPCHVVLRMGHEVTVFNARGTHRCVARVSPRARPGVVNGLGIWWRKLGRDGTNVNELTSQQPDRHGTGAQRFTTAQWK